MPPQAEPAAAAPNLHPAAAEWRAQCCRAKGSPAHHVASEKAAVLATRRLRVYQGSRPLRTALCRRSAGGRAQQ